MYTSFGLSAGVTDVNLIPDRSSDWWSAGHMIEDVRRDPAVRPKFVNKP